MAEQGFAGGSRSIQVSACIWFATVSLAKVSDMAVPRVSVGGTYKGGGIQGGSKTWGQQSSQPTTDSIFLHLHPATASYVSRGMGLETVTISSSVQSGRDVMRFK